MKYELRLKQTTKIPTLETLPLLLFPVLNGIIAAWAVRMNGLFSIIAMFFSGWVLLLNATRKDWKKEQYPDLTKCSASLTDIIKTVSHS